MDFKRHVDCFLKLLDNHHVAEFLKRDTCGALCDKYHLVIVFQFFMRADFQEVDYTPQNFFLGLTLSHDLYDESKALKHIIMAYYLSRNFGSKCKSKSAFHWAKLLLFRRMQFKGFMEKRICQRLCALVQHKAFYRNRKMLHTGIVRCSVLCDKCRCPMNEAFSLSSQKSDKSDKNKTPCNVEDVSELVTGHKSKRARRNSLETEKGLFFPDDEPGSLSDQGSSVASIC